jgi:hypothetical protein
VDRSLFAFIILVAVVGVVVLGIGIAVTYNGMAEAGGQLIGVGSTILGSSIVGLFLARVSATLGGQIQEGIDARKEHKRQIDELAEYLLSGSSTPVASHYGMNFLAGYLAVQNPIRMNLELIPLQPKKKLLWADLSKHWPDTKSKADEYLGTALAHNKEVNTFVEDCEKRLKERVSGFLPKAGDGSGKVTESDQRAVNDWSLYAANRIAANSSFVMGYQAVEPELKVALEDLNSLPIPASLELGGLVVDMYDKSKPEEIPPELKELVSLGKEGVKRRYYEKLASFLQEVIAGTVDELRRNPRLISLKESKTKLDATANQLMLSLNEILVSKSVPGRCDYVRVG